MEIRMAKFWEVIIESCVISEEFPITSSIWLLLRQLAIEFVEMSEIGFL